MTSALLNHVLFDKNLQDMIRNHPIDVMTLLFMSFMAFDFMSECVDHTWSMEIDQNIKFSSTAIEVLRLLATQKLIIMPKVYRSANSIVHERGVLKFTNAGINMHHDIVSSATFEQMKVLRTYCLAMKQEYWYVNKNVL